MSENIIDGSCSNSSQNNFIFPTLETRQDSSDGGSAQRGRRKAAELQTTSGAKQALTWQGAVKWGDLAIGLAVASRGETGTVEEN